MKPTTYQRRKLKRENALGVMVRFFGNGPAAGTYSPRVFNEDGKLVFAPDQTYPTDEAAAHAGMEWARQTGKAAIALG